jgi:hypothetical protein
MVATHAYNYSIWITKLCLEVRLSEKAITIQCDSNSAICCLDKNPIFHVKKKNIDMQYHFIRDRLDDGKLILEKVGNLHNVVYALTKPVSTSKFK